MKLNSIYRIDALKGLKKLKDDSVDCIITSPPYWALRDYENKNQIGVETNPLEFVNKIVEIIKECKRVVKPTGTIWLNLGDSYYTDIASGIRGEIITKYKKKIKKSDSNLLQLKQKLLIPYRIAIKCQDELGLILRNDLHWIKQMFNFKTKDSWGYSMPSAVQDRLNTCSESLFFFVKNKRYYFNLNKIKIPKRTSSGSKNPGDCVIFPLEPSKEKHSAMFPQTLPEFCILSGCPEKGIVLDPFMGSGTTAIVAKRLNRNFIGFDLNKGYIQIANRRLSQIENGK